MRKALTDTFVRSLRPPADGRTEVADIRSAGLSFRVSSNGACSWCFRFRDPRSRKTTRATIGEYPTITLSEARRQAEDLRRLVAIGKNPVTEKRREQDAAANRTFHMLAERYLNEHARRHKRSAAADERNLRLHVLPRWRKRRYDEIARADIIELVESLVAAGKSTLANRVQALISSIYSFAMDADLVKGNPCARLRRRGVERVGRRVLSDHEIRLFWSGIVQKPVSRRVGLALRLVLLTGVRPGEAAGLTLSELENISIEGRARWVIPALRSKNGRPHLVPLAELARQTVLSALELPNQDDRHLFPSPAIRGAPITVRHQHL
jgi:integrase